MFKMYFLYDQKIVIDCRKPVKHVFKGKIVTDTNNKECIILRQEPVVTGCFSNLLPVAVHRTEWSFFDKNSNDFELKILTNKHPNIVTYYGLGEDENFYYKIEELCECSVYDILEKHTNKTVYFNDILNSLSNKDVLKQSLSGLSFIHGLGLYHGNIHPGNFLISKTDQNQFVIKLTDFKQKTTDNTKRSDYAMKEGWIAPEFYDKTCDQKTDAFVFGCFIFYILSNNHPFGNSLLNQHVGVIEEQNDVYKKSWVPLTMDRLCIFFNQEISEFELEKTNILIKELVVFSRKDRKKINEISLM